MNSDEPLPPIGDRLMSMLISRAIGYSLLELVGALGCSAPTLRTTMTRLRKRGAIINYDYASRRYTTVRRVAD